MPALDSGKGIDLEESKRKMANALKELNLDVPSAKGYSDLPFDREQAFIIYASLGGHVPKTSAALGVSEEDIFTAEKEGDWRGRIKALTKLRESGRPGDVERAINRAVNFAQAARMRSVLDRLISKFVRMSDDELIELCISMVVKSSKNKDVVAAEEVRVSTRAFADLSSALEKIHTLSYLALSDGATERRHRAEHEEDSGGKANLKDIHAALSDAVSKAAGEQSTRSILFTEQSAQLSSTVVEQSAKS
jgi:hypothetical protein